MTRHQRRKAAKLRAFEKAVRLAKADRASQVQAVVEKNLSNPHRPARSPKGLGNRSVYDGALGGFARGAMGGITRSIKNEDLPRKYRS